MRRRAVLECFALFSTLSAGVESRSEISACSTAAAETCVTNVLATECLSRQSCSVCALVGASQACEDQVLCRVLNSTGVTAETRDDIRIEEQWIALPTATNGPSLQAQEISRVLSSSHVSIDGYELVDGKPSAVLKLPDELVAGFRNLSVLKLRNVSLQNVQLPAMPRVHTLDFSGDGLTDLDAKLSRHALAQSTLPLTLVLERNLLIEIPSVVFTLSNLRVLRLRHNAIKQQRLSSAQFEFLSSRLTTLEVDADAFQATGCDAVIQFQSNPNLSTCDPTRWLQVPSTPNESSAAAPAANVHTNSDSDADGSASWAVWVGAIATFLVVSGGVVCALAKRDAVKRLLHRRWEVSENRSDAYGAATHDEVQQMSDAVCYRAFQDLPSDSSTLSLDEQLFEAWRRDPRLITLLRPLGSGGQKSLTWLGAYRDEEVVVKTLPDAALEADRALFVVDMRTVARFSHPNIVRFRGVAWSKGVGMQALLEYMDRGDLQTYLSLARSSRSRTVAAANYPLAWWGTRLLEIALDVAQALLYMHAMKRASHCGLTSRHVLLNHEFDAKISSFGFVRNLAEYGADPASPLASSSSTQTAAAARLRSSEVVRWTAPELLSGSVSSDAGLSEAVDMYSFGVILSELDTLEYPFERVQRELKLSEAQLLERLVDGTLQPTVSASCPAAARELLLACVARDPSERPTAAMVVQSLRELTADVSREASIAGGRLLLSAEYDKSVE